MEAIRFVLEAPQVNKVQRKRPRLVKACDNCRSKKIKCSIQPGPDAICSACSKTCTPCCFRDREQYFAARARSANLARSKSGEMAQLKATEISVHTLPTDDGEPPALATDTIQPEDCATHSSAQRAHMYRPDLPRSGSFVEDMNLSIPSLGPELFESESFLPTSLTSQLCPLFDPQEPDRPHSSLMMTYMLAFFDNLSVRFPFLTFDEITRQFFKDDLTMLMANCIAALAIEYTNIPEVLDRGVMYVTDLHIEKAKVLLMQAIANFRVPDIDTLHSIILLAWAEYKRDRMSQFCYYSQMAIQMAFDFQLNDENTIRMATTENKRNSLRHTWACITQLDVSMRSQSCYLPIVLPELYIIDHIRCAPEVTTQAIYLHTVPEEISGAVHQLC